MDGQLYVERENWGDPFEAKDLQGREHLLKGGFSLPAYTNPGFPLTWTSSLKTMQQDTFSLEIPSEPTRASAKRKHAKINETENGSKTKKVRFSSETVLSSVERAQSDGHRDKAVQVLINAIDESECTIENLEIALKKKGDEIKELQATMAAAQTERAENAPS